MPLIRKKRFCKQCNKTSIHTQKIDMCNSCYGKYRRMNIKLRGKCKECQITVCYAWTNNRTLCRVCYVKIKNAKYVKEEIYRFDVSVHIAHKRGLSWNISKKHYYVLIKQKCYYCGFNLNKTGVGLDRINNKYGYSIKNVVPCCGYCNILRNNKFTHEEMSIIGKTIRKVLALRVTL